MTWRCPKCGSPGYIPDAMPVTAKDGGVAALGGFTLMDDRYSPGTCLGKCRGEVILVRQGVQVTVPTGEGRTKELRGTSWYARPRKFNARGKGAPKPKPEEA